MKIKKKPQAIWLRIILLPEKRLSIAASSLALQCSKFSKVYYNIDDKKNLAHLTVYYGKFPADARQKVFKVVEKISIKYSEIDLDYEKVDILEGFLWLRFKLKGDLKRIQEGVLGELKSLGEVHPNNSKENYQPHLSLLRYKNEKLDFKVFTKKLLVNKVNFNSKWNYLAVAYGEEHGTVTKILKKYKLK